MHSRQNDRPEKRRRKSRSADRAESRQYSKHDGARNSIHHRDQRDEARDYRPRQKDRDRSRSPRRGPRSSTKDKTDGRYDDRDRHSMSRYTQREDRDELTAAKASKALSDQKLNKQRQVEIETTSAGSGDQMMAALGFGGFGSTKDKKISGNSAGGIYREQKPVKYRQYMNRVGGFNRPLES